MTMTESNGSSDTLSDSEARVRAREEYRLDPGLSGAELGRRYGRSGRWGTKQIAEVRKENGTVPAARPPAAVVVPERKLSKVESGIEQRRPARKRHAARSARPVPLVVVAVAASVMVGVVTGVSSYTHIRDLAVTHGMGELAGWLPFGVDGLVIACTCSLIVDRRDSQRGSLLAWTGVVLGLVGSVAANVLAAPADPVSRVLAAYPPIALALSVHQVFRMLGDR